MKSVEQILSRLESLASADRQWIVEHLPDDAKSLLMNELTDSNGGTRGRANVGMGTLSNNNQLERVPPSLVAAILEAESVWVITSLLQSANKGWVTQVVDSLPSTLRSSVAISMRESNPAPAAVVVSLRNTLLRRAAMEYASITPTQTSSWWRQLVRRVRGAAT